MRDIADTIRRIVPADREAGRQVQARLDRKTKPRRSLGRLEELACRYAMARHDAHPGLAHKAIVVMAADHGIAAEGVSAYPSEVTRQMLLNFAQGGAAINALARQAGAELSVVDVGVREPVAAKGVRDMRIAAGSANMLRGPAMTPAQTRAAVTAGIDLAGELAERGFSLLGLGEMGIGNTTAASALISVLTKMKPGEAAGRGTGLDDAGVARKARLIEEAIERNRPDPQDPMDVLAKVGGLEVAALTGVTLGAVARRVPVVIDGLIATAAALVAARMAPPLTDSLIAAHRSPEPAHETALEALAQEPLLELGMRLGEGTGAALAMQLVDAALAILHEMATFDSAGVADTGR